MSAPRYLSFQIVDFIQYYPLLAIFRPLLESRVILVGYPFGHSNKLASHDPDSNLGCLRLVNYPFVHNNKLARQIPQNNLSAKKNNEQLENPKEKKKT